MPTPLSLRRITFRAAAFALTLFSTSLDLVYASFLVRIHHTGTSPADTRTAPHPPKQASTNPRLPSYFSCLGIGPTSTYHHGGGTLPRSMVSSSASTSRTTPPMPSGFTRSSVGSARTVWWTEQKYVGPVVQRRSWVAAPPLCSSQSSSSEEILQPDDGGSSTTPDDAGVTVVVAVNPPEPSSFVSRLRRYFARGNSANGLSTKERLAKMGLAVALSYGWVSNLSYCVSVSMAWYIFSKRTGLSPLAPGQWKGFLAVYSGFWVFNNIIRPLRATAAVAVSPLLERWVRAVQNRLQVKQSVAVLITVLLLNVVGTITLMCAGIAFAAILAGVPVFPVKP